MAAPRRAAVDDDEERGDVELVTTTNATTASLAAPNGTATGNATATNQTALWDTEAFKKAFDAAIEAKGGDPNKFNRNGTARPFDEPYADSRLDVKHVGRDDEGGWKGFSNRCARVVVADVA